MNEIPLLATSLPRLWKLVREISSGLENRRYTGWPDLLAALAPLTDPDWIDALDERLPGWRKIATIREGITAKHTLVVLASCLNLPEYAAANEQTRHEIEWAVVLHDLDKDLSSGRDASHPFRSAGVAAMAMTNLGFQLQPGAQPVEVAEWAELAMTAQQPLNGQMVHDHVNLREILTGLEQLWGQETPTSRILKAVLFHQSLPTLNAWPNPVLLTDTELRAALTLPDLEVLGPLLIADSDSWNLFDEPRQAYLQELRENLEKTRRKLQT